MQADEARIATPTGLMSETGVGSGGDLTIPIDPEGLVIYYTVGANRYLLNGHAGSFRDVLSDAEAGVFEALALPKPAAEWQRLTERWGARSAKAVAEVGLLRDGADPRMTPSERQKAFVIEQRPRLFTVYLAQACNLACPYCFNTRGTFGARPSVMSEDTARDVLAFIAGQVRAKIYPSVSVHLFGGEPLVAPEATKILARGLQDLNHQDLSTRIHILLFTNGTIYRKDILDILAERPDLCTVMLSLDGSREAHDRNRPFASRRRGSSYDVVVANMQRMDRDGIPYSVGCVVPHPFDFIGASEALHALGVQSLEIKEPLQHVFGRDTPDVVDYPDFDLWRRNYLAYCDYYLDHLDRPDWVTHVDRFALPAAYGSILDSSVSKRMGLSCRVAELKVGISRTGEILPCSSFYDHETYGLGNVRSGFDAERYARFEAWLLANGQHRIDHPRCRTCFAKLACNSGCYAQNLDRTGTLQPHDRVGCDYVRERVKIDLHFIAEMRRRHPHILARMTED